ncbi:MAG: hypothetical protein AAGG38_02190 [Planctomycetota bacterium]
MALTQITTQLIRNLAVTTSKIADGAVTLAKLGALTTKGDVLSHDGTDHQRLGVGTDGQVLTANSATATGLEWAAAPGSGGVALANLVYGETPSGLVNGVNDTFTLANTPETGTVRIYLNGVRMNEDVANDYTLSGGGGTITFESGQVPQTGDVILVDYISQ